MVPGLTRHPRWLKAQELNARLHLRRQVPDPELRRRLTPGYEIGCKRIRLDRGMTPDPTPGFTFEFRRRTRRFDAAAYRLAAPTTLSAGNGASGSHPPAHAR
jgi:cation diffusion facilitator CzcD-associated flavoprotein CzcO